MPLTPVERSHLRSFPTKSCHCIITGSLLEITYTSNKEEYRLPGRRGVVKGFTPAARLRMMRTVAMIDWRDAKASLFVTLTYPDSVAEREMKTRTRDRYIFLRSMENYLERKVGVLWRLEWIPRKSGTLVGKMMPHVHLIVFGVDYVPYLLINEWWKNALRVDGHVSTYVVRIRGGKDVGKYVTKYCSKPCQSPSLVNATYLHNVGRHWGIHRRTHFPWCERFVLRCLTKEQVALAENAACMTFRYFERGQEQGFSIFGDNAEKIGDILLHKHLDNGFPIN